MTRILSELLGASEPQFSLTIKNLEQMSGWPAADIKLAGEIGAICQRKLRLLGLDPNDTTAEELYHALTQKLLGDDQLVRKTLGLGLDALDGLMPLARFLRAETRWRCFALKTAVAKRIIKTNPPKKLMKQLGYRSLESMLRHEPPALIVAAARWSETKSWQQNLLTAYAKLTAVDFESRKVEIICPQSDRWRKFSAQHTAKSRQNITALSEHGALVMMPLDITRPGLAIAELVVALNRLSDIRAAGSFLKLKQVRPDFGRSVALIAQAEPDTGVSLAGQPVPWRVIHRFFGSKNPADVPDTFEPHVQADDLSWLALEDQLKSLHPALEFWTDTSFAAHAQGGQTVSLNIIDVAVNALNKLGFEQSIKHYLHYNLWHELMIRYLNQHNVESAISRQLAGETA